MLYQFQINQIKMLNVISNEYTTYVIILIFHITSKNISMYFSCKGEFDYIGESGYFRHPCKLLSMLDLDFRPATTFLDVCMSFRMICITLYNGTSSCERIYTTCIKTIQMNNMRAVRMSLLVAMLSLFLSFFSYRSYTIFLLSTRSDLLEIYFHVYNNILHAVLDISL